MKATQEQIQAFDLRNIFALLASGNKDAAMRILGKKVLTHDQYGQKSEAILCVDEDGNLLVTTKEDLE
jgi:hypothetical protein